jgi:hypothetical protein
MSDLDRALKAPTHLADEIIRVLDECDDSTAMTALAIARLLRLHRTSAAIEFERQCALDAIQQRREDADSPPS